MTATHHPTDHVPTERPPDPSPATIIGFLVTFLGGWMALDRLVTSPPTLVSASVALAVAAVVVAVGEHVVFATPWRRVPSRLGLGRPRSAALAVGAIAGVLVYLTYLGGAALLGTDPHLRSNWPVVLVSALIFHGLAEELVWRGFVFARLRRRWSFRGAVLASVPLIALTHVAIIASNGVAIGMLAVLSAAVTCVPFAHLWERGGRTIWGPAILHGAIGSWQLFERGYPDSFSAVLVLGSIVVPLVVLLWRPVAPEA